METSTLPDTKYKTMVIRILKELRGRIDELSENFNKKIVSIKQDIETMIKNQSEMKNTISEMKNTLKGIRGLNQQFGRQGSRKYPIRAAKLKKNF